MSPLHILLCLAFTAYAQILIPEPKGRYVVGHSTIKLVDSSRVDPFDPLHGPRNVMTSLFYPVPRSSCTKLCPMPYMPPATAALIDASYAQLGVVNGTFESIQLQVCCSYPSHAAKGITEFPVVLFSPGLGGTRLLYSALAQAVASSGYAVATIDHVYESQVVEYPDGTVVPAVNASYLDPTIPGRLDTLLTIRIADGRFALTQLGRKDIVQKLVPGATCGFNIKKGSAGFYGHSFGGATAIATLMQDSRFASAANLDGSQYGNFTDTHKPALFFGRAEPSPHNRTNDETWADVWGHLKGWKREVGLKQTEHISFGDTGLLVKLGKAAGLPIPDEITSVIGTLDGARSFEIIRTVVQDFFNFAFRGDKSRLLDGKDKGYPEVVVDW